MYMYNCLKQEEQSVCCAVSARRLLVHRTIGSPLSFTVSSIVYQCMGGGGLAAAGWAMDHHELVLTWNQ